MEKPGSDGVRRAFAACSCFFLGVMSWGAWLSMVFHLFDSGAFSAAGLLSLK